MKIRSFNRKEVLCEIRFYKCSNIFDFKPRYFIENNYGYFSFGYWLLDYWKRD